MLGWLLLIGVVAGSLAPAKAIELVKLSDKIEHAASYTLLMAWFGGMLSRASQFWVAAGLVVLGAALEVLQGMTPTRTPDFADLAADTLGVLVGLALSTTVLRGWCQRIERLFAVG